MPMAPGRGGSGSRKPGPAPNLRRSRGQGSNQRPAGIFAFRPGPAPALAEGAGDAIIEPAVQSLPRTRAGADMGRAASRIKAQGNLRITWTGFAPGLVGHRPPKRRGPAAAADRREMRK